MLKMQFSMARNFTLQPLRRYDVKPPEKRHKRNKLWEQEHLWNQGATKAKDM